ncbi:GAF domain-containing protein [Acidovorax sp. sic0104]|uniref:GAF domain-containing protein n=1 Tax=Acidovorax sp. sic0104 TaxID=2854784 RepID=UPI001C44C068|nr:GAF domain-containing protein [Acidovorax sp. sic0104]MBV7542368.1 GAF domain-containing protein [Acidovorax sp. sic0104]
MTNPHGLSLQAIRPCLEGAIPAIMATCDADGTPNVAYISQAVYVDEAHVALSFQFFNKTRQNILCNPRAALLVLDPRTAAFYRLHLYYERTEDHGPVFESMRAQLAGIASHAGMAGVFELKGSDIHRVERIEAVSGDTLPPPPQSPGLLHALRLGSERMSRCMGLDDLLACTLATLRDPLDIAHAMVLMLDATAEQLYTVASHGYATSGVGSEIRLGQGVIGVAAQERTPVRISHVTNAARYSHAIRHSLDTHGDAGAAMQRGLDIPYPGLPEPHSQIAVPLVSAGRLLGVLFAESPEDMRFGFEEEDLLVALAGHLAAAIDLLQAAPDAPAEPPPAAAQPPAPHGAALRVRHFAANDSVFINDDYLIKGVAGAIFCKLLRDHLASGRVDFSNRELRLDPALKLPDVADNLEARLLLLQRRLLENSPHIRIEKTGRGRFRLHLQRPVVLDATR